MVHRKVEELENRGFVKKDERRHVLRERLSASRLRIWGDGTRKEK